MSTVAQGDYMRARARFWSIVRPYGSSRDGQQRLNVLHLPLSEERGVDMDIISVLRLQAARVTTHKGASVECSQCYHICPML